MRSVFVSRRRTIVIGFVVAAILGSSLPYAFAAKGGGSCKRTNTCSPADTTAPTVSISSPSGGSTVSGSITIAGSASDNVALRSVDVEMDASAFSSATGTSSWSLSYNTTGLTNGTHTITARATDTSGNVRSVTQTITTSNTTSSPTPTPTPTQSTPPSPSPTPTQTTPPPPGCQVDPYGVTICIASTSGWTFSQIESMLIANARELSTIGPTVTINVEDGSPSTATTSTVCCRSGRYYNFTGTINLEGNTGTFASFPDSVLAHEYGHIWTLYHLYISQNGSWSAFLNERWTSSSGLLLVNDSRLDSQYMWSKLEIMADDYRLLFGSSSAISETPTHLNTQILDPRDQPGLGNWMITYWGVLH